MTDWTFSPAPTTAIVGIVTTGTTYAIATTSAYVVELSTGGVGASGTTGKFSIFNTTRPGYLTGRRPAKGQMYPRGVYNK
mgnify:CR=1 FL=1